MAGQLDFSLNPFLSIWTRPRATIASLISNKNYKWSPWIIVGLLFSSYALNGFVVQFAEKPEGLSYFWMIISFPFVLGVLNLWIFALILQVIDRAILSGDIFRMKPSAGRVSAKSADLRMVIGWALLPSLVPNLVSASLFILGLPSDWASASAEHFQAGIPYAEIWGPLVFIWSLSLMVIMSSEVQKAPIWKATIGIVVAFILLSLPYLGDIDF